MRKTCKLLGAVMAAIIILTSFSMFVMADNPQKKASGTQGEFDWEFYDNNELKIKCKNSTCFISCVPQEYRDKADKVTFDLTNAPYRNSMCIIDGASCAAKLVYVTGCENGSIYYLSLEDFPNVTSNNVSIPNSTSIDIFGLKNVGLTTIDFLDNSKIEGLDVKDCKNLEKVVLSSKVTEFFAKDCPKLKTVTNISYLESLSLNNTPLLNFSIPAGIKYLSWYDYPNSEVVVPKNPRARFSGSKLEKATLESGRTEINSMMFYNCYNLKSVSIPNTVTSIEYKAFCYCSNLMKLDIPSSVTSIGDEAFSSSGLQKVYIPTSVEDLSYSAFDDCTSLTDVYYGGTREQLVDMLDLLFGTPETFFGDGVLIHYNASLPGWKNDNGTWRYFDDNGVKVTGWKRVDEFWYFFDDNGAMVTGWKQSGSDWYYLDPATGAMVTGWKQVGGKWYWFDALGKMVSGAPFLIDGKTYVFKSNGEMVTGGWYKGSDSSNGNSSWFYLGSDGVAAEGWKKIDGKWYYFYATGSMAEFTWIEEGGKKYFVDSNGAMFTGWKKFGEYWYYFKSNGEMAANEYCNGYWLDSDGKWTYQYVAKWNKNSTGWWYGDTAGWYAKNTSIKIDGKVYNFNASGYCTNP